MTANIAINLRAHVCLRRYDSGRILVDIKGVGKQEFYPPHLPLVGPFALVSAAVCYFGVHGLHIEIKTDFPFQSGLGGSGAVAIAFIGALNAALNRRVPSDKHFPRIVRIAHNLEDSLFRNTGIQDQAAAVYGGANLWEWKYSDHLDFIRQRIVSDTSSLDQHILLAYTGRPHQPSRNGSQMLNKFKESGDLGILVAISEHARRFAKALKCRDFRAAGASLAAEHHLRSALLPVERKDDLELIAMAANAKCGVNLLGTGGGGCIWAIGEAQDIADLKGEWLNAFERRSVGSVLPVKATGRGLEVSIEQKGTALVDAHNSEHLPGAILETKDAPMEAP